MKTLIAYYSRAGHTAEVAKKIAAITGADLFEIKTTKNYGSYAKAIVIARREFNNNELPKLVGDVKDFESYDRILIGYPVWYSKAPQVVIAFLKAHDLTGKDVYSFCTSGMSGPEGAQAQLADACKGATMHSGKRFAEVAEDEVNAWLAT